MAAKSIQQDVRLNIEQCSISQYNGKSANLAISLCGVMNYILSEDDLMSCFKSFERNILPKGFLIIDFLDESSFDNAGFPHFTDDFSRVVTVTKSSGGNYHYSEACKGTLNGKNFEYSDEFKLRRWWAEEINQMLKDSGFMPVKEISDLKSAGYACQLYRKE
jgi:hypothetical protein